MAIGGRHGNQGTAPPLSDDYNNSYCFSFSCNSSPRPGLDAARHRMYMRRNTLHHELQLPDGYGERV